MEQNTLSELKEKEKDARRTIIVDAAEKEFATKPFNKVNMRVIAKRAGISPALIYRHFPDQQSLFAETFTAACRKYSGEYTRRSTSRLTGLSKKSHAYS